MNQYVLFNHIGSENHGCEALVRTVSQLLGSSCTLLSENPNQDARYGVEDVIQVKAALSTVPKWSPDFIRAYAELKLGRIIPTWMQLVFMGRSGGCHLELLEFLSAAMCIVMRITPNIS